jgi:hypothetical protein
MKTLIAIVLLSISMNASAATAMLVNCKMSTSFTGQLVYVGTYTVAGQYFTQVTTYYCPAFIEVY